MHLDTKIESKHVLHNWREKGLSADIPICVHRPSNAYWTQNIKCSGFVYIRYIALQTWNIDPLILKYKLTALSLSIFLLPVASVSVNEQYLGKWPRKRIRMYLSGGLVVFYWTSSPVRAFRVLTRTSWATWKSTLLDWPRIKNSQGSL